MDCEFVKEYFWSDEKRLKEEYFLLNGKIEGELRTYHFNGQLELSRFYVDGKRHGECKKFFSNGILREFAIFDNDKLIFDEEYCYDGETVLRKIDLK